MQTIHSPTAICTFTGWLPTVCVTNPGCQIIQKGQEEQKQNAMCDLHTYFERRSFYWSWFHHHHQHWRVHVVKWWALKWQGMKHRWAETVSQDFVYNMKKANDRAPEVLQGNVCMHVITQTLSFSSVLAQETVSNCLPTVTDQSPLITNWITLQWRICNFVREGSKIQLILSTIPSIHMEAFLVWSNLKWPKAYTLI